MGHMESNIHNKLFSSKHGLVVSGQNKMYMAGGEYPDGSASKAVWRYDPTLDVWQEVESMQKPRSELGEFINIRFQIEYIDKICFCCRIFSTLPCVDFTGLALLDGFVYAVGGWEGTSRLDSVERYNSETNTWHSIPSLRMAVTSPAVVTHDGKKGLQHF